MVTSQERLKILQMLEAGKISAEEAAKLLEATGQQEEGQPPALGRGHWLIIRVSEGDKSVVNLRIPIKLAEWALRFVPRKYLEQGGMTKQDLEQVVAQALEAGKAQLIDVHDGKDHVQISIE